MFTRTRDSTPPAGPAPVTVSAGPTPVVIQSSRSARWAVTLGVIGSLAGNIAWAAPRSGVLVGVGVLMSLVLPVAVHLWRVGDGVTGWARAERALVMTFVCVGAAFYTLVHAAQLLQENGLPDYLAWCPAAVLEALVVMATRAGSRRPVDPRDEGAAAATTTRTRAARSARRDTRPRPASTPAVTAADAAPAHGSRVDLTKHATPTLTPEEAKRARNAAASRRARDKKKRSALSTPAGVTDIRRNA